jgi:hypothetical protein
MKLRHFHILLILLFALILCPLLGGYCGPEGLTNIEQHLKDSHGVSVSSTSNSETSSSSNSEAAQEENAKLKERLALLEKQMSSRQDNNVENKPVEVPSNLDNVGGDMRKMGALENNKIPEHEHTEESKCPPCPPCARCPEPSFSCKKVPNYKSNNDQFPRAILANFSNFGM